MQLTPTADLARIASAGGGFRIDASQRPTADLITIARAANGVGRIVLTGLKLRPVEDLVSIARAGNGSVMFED